MGGHLRIEGIEKKFGDIEALDYVTLDVEAGRIVTIVGVNGSGKTTLLRILAGLEEPGKGDILFDRKKMEMRELRRISTLVFQKNVVFDTSVYENVAFGLKVRGFSREEIESRVSQALTTVGLSDFQKRRAKHLSGGEQQRAALARAFAIEPEILLLDEPTVNLDPTNAIIIENAIKEMRDRSMSTRGKCTILLATHNLHQAKRLSDKIVHIHNGKILEIASPKDFFTNPSSQMTRKFINGELQF